MSTNESNGVLAKIGPGTTDQSETQIKTMSQVARRPQVLADQETVIRVVYPVTVTFKAKAGTDLNDVNRRIRSLVPTDMLLPSAADTDQLTGEMIPVEIESANGPLQISLETNDETRWYDQWGNRFDPTTAEAQRSVFTAQFQVNAQHLLDTGRDPKKFQELDTAGRINWREGAGQISVLADDVNDAVSMLYSTFFAYFQPAINLNAGTGGRFSMNKFLLIQGVQRVGQVQVNARTPIID